MMSALTQTRADGRVRARLAAFELLEELSLSEGFVGKRNRVVAVGKRLDSVALCSTPLFLVLSFNKRFMLSVNL